MPTAKQNSLSEREKLMLPTAFAIIILILYGVFRWRPVSAEFVDLQKELSSALKGREKLQFPAGKHTSVEQLKKRFEQVRTELKQTGESLAQAEESLVDLDSNHFQRLKIQISDLAQSSGLTIIESVPYGTNGKGSSSSSYFADPERTPEPSALTSAPVIHEFFNTLYARPLQIMTVQSSFTALLRFVHGLDSLQWRVSLMAFDIEADVQDQQSIQSLSPPKLTSNLLLAF